MNKELLIFSCLLTKEDYVRKILPYLKLEYFQNTGIKILLEIFSQYWEKYKVLPSRDAMYIELEKRNLNEVDYEEAKSSLKEVKNYNESLEWLVDTTEEYFKDRALYIALMQSIERADSSEQVARGEIPKILSEALSVSFDPSIGLNIFESSSAIWEKITEQYDRIPTHISMLNRITLGGFPKKTLTIFMGPTGTGKSLVIQNIGANMAKNGANVLIVSLELSEAMVSMRILMDLLDMSSSEISSIPKNNFIQMLDECKRDFHGKLFIKEYPPQGASTDQLQYLLDDYERKKGFKPDVLVLDYLTLLRPSSFYGQNSYTLYKQVAEELRAIAVRNNLSCISAMQTNRSAYGASDYGSESTSESIGVSMTADVKIALIRTEEFDERGLMIFKQLKNRLREENLDRRFLVGANRSRMRIFDVEQDTNDDGSKKVEEAVTLDKPLQFDKKTSNQGFESFKFG